MAKSDCLRYELFIGALIPLAALLFITITRFGISDGLTAAVLFILSLMVHELGHAVVAQVTGTKFSAIGACWKGAYIRRERAKGATEFLISFAGPAVNCLLAVALWNTGGIITWLAQMNAILVVFNLLPVPGSDGHRMMTVVREYARPLLGASSQSCK